MSPMQKRAGCVWKSDSVQPENRSAISFHFVEYKNNRITERQCAAAISANSCCANQTLTLAPNGDIFTCDLIDHTPIGNVYNIDLNDFALSDLLRKTNMKGCSIV